MWLSFSDILCWMALFGLNWNVMFWEGWEECLAIMVLKAHYHRYSTIFSNSLLLPEKTPLHRLSGWCPSHWNACPSLELHNVQRAGLSDSLTSLTGPHGSRMLGKIYLDKIFQILTFSDPVTEQGRKLLLFKMPDSYFQWLTDFPFPKRIYKLALYSSFFLHVNCGC